MNKRTKGIRAVDNVHPVIQLGLVCVTEGRDPGLASVAPGSPSTGVMGASAWLRVLLPVKSEWQGSWTRTPVRGLGLPLPTPIPVPWDSGLCFLPLQLFLPPPSVFLRPHLDPSCISSGSYLSPQLLWGRGGKEVASSLLSFPILMAWVLKPPPQAQHPTPVLLLTSRGQIPGTGESGHGQKSLQSLHRPLEACCVTHFAM